jgi:hypothetical protein
VGAGHLHGQGTALANPTLCLPKNDLSAGCELRLYATTTSYATLKALPGPIVDLDKTLQLEGGLKLPGLGATGNGAPVCLDATGTVQSSTCPLPWIDVRVQFGAVCDGHTDDTAKVQAGATATAASGSSLYIPAACAVRSITLANNMHFVGANRNTSKFVEVTGAAVSGRGMFETPTPTPVSNISFAHLGFDGNFAGNPSRDFAGLKLANVTHVDLDDLEMYNFGAAELDAGGSGVVGYGPWNDLWLHNSYLHDCVMNVSPTYHNVACVYPGAGGNRVRITDSTIDASSTSVGTIKLTSLATPPEPPFIDTQVSRNHLITNDATNQGTMLVELWGNPAVGCLISDNIFSGTNSSDAGHSSWAISFSEAGNCTVVGNYFHWINGISVELIGSNNVVVGNTFDDGGTISINNNNVDCMNGMNNNTVTGNNFFNLLHGQAVSVYVQGCGGQNNVAITDNTIDASLMPSRTGVNQNGPIGVQTNGGSPTGNYLRGLTIANNRIRGSGPMNGMAALYLQNDGGNIFDDVRFTNNTLNGWQYSIGRRNGSITNWLSFGNKYTNVTSIITNPSADTPEFDQLKNLAQIGTFGPPTDNTYDIGLNNPGPYGGLRYRNLYLTGTLGVNGILDIRGGNICVTSPSLTFNPTNAPCNQSPLNFIVASGQPAGPINYQVLNGGAVHGWQLQGSSGAKGGIGWVGSGWGGPGYGFTPTMADVMSVLGQGRGTTFGSYNDPMLNLNPTGLSTLTANSQVEATWTTSGFTHVVPAVTGVPSCTGITNNTVVSYDSATKRMYLCNGGNATYFQGN